MGANRVPRDYKDYVCGFGASVVNMSSTFPINKIIFRQMLHGQNSKTAALELWNEGLVSIYRGILPPLIQRSVNISLMFGTFNTYGNLLEKHCRDVIPSAYGRLCLAAFSAGSTEAMLCPFERVQMLLQDNRKVKLYKNTVDAFQKLRVFGFREYYRGISAIILRNGPSNILFFTFRDKVKALLPRGPAPSVASLASPAGRILPSEMLRDFITGSLVGACISTIFYPLNVVRTQMQTQRPGSKYLGLIQAFKLVWIGRGRSWRLLYRGVHINYTRSFVSWGIINATYELLHRLLP